MKFLFGCLYMTWRKRSSSILFTSPIVQWYAYCSCLILEEITLKKFVDYPWIRKGRASCNAVISQRYESHCCYRLSSWKPFHLFSHSPIACFLSIAWYLRLWCWNGMVKSRHVMLDNWLFLSKNLQKQKWFRIHLIKPRTCYPRP